MKFLILSVLAVVSLLFFTACPTSPEASIFKTWVSSPEDQTGRDISCYRPSDYDFPTVRGVRSSFQFNEDGTFVYTYQGPTDAVEQEKGTWKTVSDTRYAVTFDDPNPRFAKTFNIDVVSLEDGLLKIKKPDMANPNPPKDVTELITKTWVNSYEDERDPNNEKWYRPSTYDFPPSRGRTGFTFKPDGSFSYNYPGPTDVPTSDKGKWLRLSDNRIKVTFDEPRTGRVDEFIMAIISIDEEILKIERLKLMAPRDKK